MKPSTNHLASITWGFHHLAESGPSIFSFLFSCSPDLLWLRNHFDNWDRRVYRWQPFVSLWILGTPFYCSFNVNTRLNFTICSHHLIHIWTGWREKDWKCLSKCSCMIKQVLSTNYCQCSASIMQFLYICFNGHYNKNQSRAPPPPPTSKQVLLFVPTNAQQKVKKSGSKFH